MSERVKPGAGKTLKMIMLDKDIKRKDFAEAYQSRPNVSTDGTLSKRSGHPNSVYNMLNRDNMTFATVKEMADILGCDIVFRDRETGKEY